MWKQIKNFDYEINKEGIIRRISNQRIKKSIIRKDGYIGIQLYISKTKHQTFQLHRLLAEAFIPNPNNKPCINHIDSNRSNNNLNNLEWATYSENALHGNRYGKMSTKGERNGFSKLTEKDILEIRELRKTKNISYSKIAKLYNVSNSCISGILLNINWKHI